MSYAEQTTWREIQEFLPADYQIPAGEEPTEEWWEPASTGSGHRIHLDTYRNPEAPAKLILLHGVGTNGRQLMTILGRPLAQRGWETIAIDMPTYGVTEVAPGALVTYDDWVRIGADLVATELARDDRPVVLYGLSAGGMEAFHIAALEKRVAGVVGMCFLDQQERKVRVDTAFDPVTGLVGARLMSLLARTPLRRLRLPMRLVSKMRALVNDRAAKRACYSDKTSAGNSASIAFLDSYLNYRAAAEPEHFDTCPVLLTQPADDRWTPLELSRPFLDRLGKVPVDVVMLDDAGHYPIERPGLDQLVDAVDGFLTKASA